MKSPKPVFERLRHDYTFRSLALSCGSLLLGVFITSYDTVIASLTGSVWYIALAFYYGMLLVMRGVVLYSRRKAIRLKEGAQERQRRDLTAYLATGALLVPLMLLFFGVLAVMVAQDRYTRYEGITIYVAALYSFVKISLAVYNLVKANKQDDYAVRALRSINIADALVSVVSLQAAMLGLFRGEGIDPPLFNAVTGGTAGAIILSLGSFMIVNGVKKLKNRDT